LHSKFLSTLLGGSNIYNKITPSLKYKDTAFDRHEYQKEHILQDQIKT